MHVQLHHSEASNEDMLPWCVQLHHSDSEASNEDMLPCLRIRSDIDASLFTLHCERVVFNV